jgi:hypothetical protein
MRSFNPRLDARLKASSSSAMRCVVARRWKRDLKERGEGKGSKGGCIRGDERTPEVEFKVETNSGF